jgi:glycosyltransferase involved in cell wall biosynthesis
MKDFSNEADVTVCTATIPSRSEMLKRAITSVQNQTQQPLNHIVKLDQNKIGGAAMIDLIVNEVKTKYLMILDDDDEFLPEHIESLYSKIEEEQADLVYPHFKYATRGDGGHLEQFFNVPWDNRNPHQVPLTWICRTDVFLEAGGFSKDFDPNSYNLDEQGNRIGYDFLFILRLVQMKKKIVHLPKVTWIYHDDRLSTLGMPNRW